MADGDTVPLSPYEKFNNSPHTSHEHVVGFTPHVSASPPPGYPQAGYNQTGPSSSGGQVIITPLPVREAVPSWSWCNLVTAIFSLFCCTIFGVIATVTAILAYVDHKTKDYVRSRNKRGLAYGFGTAAIVIGTLTLLVIIILVTVVGFDIQQTINNRGH